MEIYGVPIEDKKTNSPPNKLPFSLGTLFRGASIFALMMVTRTMI